MRALWVWTTLLALVPVLGGCKALLYTPNAHTIPLFDGGGQAQASASLNQDSGLDLQVAGSPVAHVLLFATGSVTNLDRYEQCSVEGGGGLYVGLPYDTTLELLAGTGGGRAEGEGRREVESEGDLPASDPYSYVAAYRRSFAQVNLGARTDGGALLVGGALRLAWVRYDEFETAPEDLVEEVRGVYLEPALLFRARVNRFVDLEGQMGYSYSVSEENWELFGRTERYGSVGVRFHLGRP